MELLAQILELLSVMSQRKQLKSPITVPRPRWFRPSGRDEPEVGLPFGRARAATPAQEPAAAAVAARATPAGPRVPRVAGQPRRTGSDPSYGRAMAMLRGSSAQRGRP